MEVNFNAKFIDDNGFNASFGEVIQSGGSNQMDQFLAGTLTDLTSPVTSITQQYALYRCASLESLDLPNCVSITGGSSFPQTSLKHVNAPKLETLAASAFSATLLEEIELPSLLTFVNQGQFNACTLLKYADLGKVNRISRQCFQDCVALEAVVLRKTDEITTLENVNAFTGSGVALGTGYVYVTDALVNSYKAASGWSTYATQIKGISELPSEYQRS